MPDPTPTVPPGDPVKYAKAYQEGYDAAYRDWQQLNSGSSPSAGDVDGEKKKRKTRLKKKLDIENTRAKNALEKGYDDGWTDAQDDLSAGYSPKP